MLQTLRLSQIFVVLLKLFYLAKLLKQSLLYRVTPNSAPANRLILDTRARYKSILYYCIVCPVLVGIVQDFI